MVSRFRASASGGPALAHRLLDLSAHATGRDPQPSVLIASRSIEPALVHHLANPTVSALQERCRLRACNPAFRELRSEFPRRPGPAAGAAGASSYRHPSFLPGRERRLAPSSMQSARYSSDNELGGGRRGIGPGLAVASTAGAAETCVRRATDPRGRESADGEAGTGRDLRGLTQRSAERGRWPPIQRLAVWPPRRTQRDSRPATMRLEEASSVSWWSR